MEGVVDNNNKENERPCRGIKKKPFHEELLQMGNKFFFFFGVNDFNAPNQAAGHVAQTVSGATCHVHFSFAYWRDNFLAVLSFESTLFKIFREREIEKDWLDVFKVLAPTF